MIADKAFDCDWIIEEMNKRKAKIVISQRSQRKHLPSRACINHSTEFVDGKNHINSTREFLEPIQKNFEKI